MNAKVKVMERIISHIQQEIRKKCSISMAMKKVVKEVFEYGGKNNFGGRFDFFEWSAPYYENPEEVYIALDGMKLKGKTLKAIYAIGACRYSGGTNKQKMLQTLQNAGFTPKSNLLEKYKRIDKVLVPWSVTLCEPLQLVFEDGTTVEILPTENGGARVGRNSIPVGLVDGLKRSCFDANAYFGEFLGRELTDIELKISTHHVRCIDSFWQEYGDRTSSVRTEYSIEFNFGLSYQLEMVQGWESWYEVRAEVGYGQKQLPYQRVKQAFSVASGDDEIQIVNGQDAGGTFWIVGFSHDEDRKNGIPSLDCFGMSIDDYIVESYLAEFLYRYFDPSIQEDAEYTERHFDWYGGNLYSFDSMKKMLCDIRQAMQWMTEDFDNPGLTAIKSHWWPHRFTTKRRDELTDEELNELRKKMVPMLLDFYERFCTRIEHMLKIPGHDTMSFAGP